MAFRRRVNTRCSYRSSRSSRDSADQSQGYWVSVEPKLAASCRSRLVMRIRARSSCAAAMLQASAKRAADASWPAISRASASTCGVKAPSQNKGLLNPWRRALRDTLALPAAVLGPVLLRALARLAAILATLGTGWAHDGSGFVADALAAASGIVFGENPAASEPRGLLMYPLQFYLLFQWHHTPSPLRQLMSYSSWFVLKNQVSQNNFCVDAHTLPVTRGSRRCAVSRLRTTRILWIWPSGDPSHRTKRLSQPDRPDRRARHTRRRQRPVCQAGRAAWIPASCARSVSPAPNARKLSPMFRPSPKAPSLAIRPCSGLAFWLPPARPRLWSNYCKLALPKACDQRRRRRVWQPTAPKPWHRRRPNLQR